MAFSEVQKIAISKALKITPDDLNARILYLGSRLTAEIETELNSLATLWNAVPNDGIEIFPTGSNEGVRKSRGAVRSEYAGQMAVLLELENDYGSSDSFTIERG